MGKPLGSSDQGRRGATDIDALADQTSAIGGRGEPAVGPEGGGGDTLQHASRLTVRFGAVAGRGSGQARSGVVAPAPRPTTKTTEQRLLSPCACNGNLTPARPFVSSRSSASDRLRARNDERHSFTGNNIRFSQDVLERGLRFYDKLRFGASSQLEICIGVIADSGWFIRRHSTDTALAGR